MKSILRRGAALGVAAACAAAVAGAPSAAADASTCYFDAVFLVNQNTWVRSGPSYGTVLYTLPAGAGFRIRGGPIHSGDGVQWMYGHGNGLADGWVPGTNLTCW